ncbi:31663_t:CDS:10, partial [Racocetra persica]
MSNENLSDVYTNLKFFAIFPALNVARVGNSEEYYVGSEIPGVYVGKGNESFRFKDAKQRVKPQAARFRIYGYDRNKELKREIKLTEADIAGVKIEITWTVELANKKAAHTKFDGILKYKESGPKRNANWPYDRSTLMAIAKESLSAEEPKTESDKSDINQKIKELPAEKELEAFVYRHSNDDKSGQKLRLGKIILEKTGSLLVIGGKGESGCIKDGGLITEYANNDYWYDDTSDGSSKSWVLVAPPKYAPGIPNLVSLYQIISETQHPVDPEHLIDPDVVFDLDNPATEENKKVNYFRDIRPIFEAVCRNSWVNKNAFNGHGLHKQGDFLNPDIEKHLQNPPGKNEDEDNKNEEWRRNILSRVRIPKYLASPAEFNGQAYDYFMPPLSGDGGIARPTAPNTYLTVTRGQYLLLQKWADGDFVKGNQPEKEYIYQFKMNEEDNPRYVENGEKKKFEEVVCDVHKQIKCLNKAALQWSVGGGLHPGIEMTFIAYDKNTFSKKHDFRINTQNIRPGDINAYLALPWQADFYECKTIWWPAQRPDVTIPEKRIDDIKKYGVRLEYFEDWTRGFETDEPRIGMPKWGDMDMVRKWDRQVSSVLLGFIVERNINNKQIDKAFFEFERDKIFKINIKEITTPTLDELYEMLKIAMKIELTNIPPYLYAMYSIKPGTEIGDEVRRQIRHVVAEEMLHLSLVANLITAIGRQPILYSQEMIPYYPNPLPHISQGTILVHLSKANKTTLETFIKIEEPDDIAREKKPETVQTTKLNNMDVAMQSIKLNPYDIDATSVGALYETIKEAFIFLTQKTKIKYNTLFQLGPGMGYTPRP